MIAYREVVERLRTADAVARLLRHAENGDSLAFVVECGVLEQAVVDALHPRADGWGPIEAALRRATTAGAEALTGGRHAAVGAAALREAAALLDRTRPALPVDVQARRPEGYADYGLDPLAYAESARAYLRDAGTRARVATVIGVRSIGTSLAAIVAATIGAPPGFTVRPRGESGARGVVDAPNLAALVRQSLARGGDALIIDEGPGITGETFDCIADWLIALGAAPERIVLFASGAGAMPLAPPARRARYHARRRYLPPPRDPRPGQFAARHGVELVADLSAGAWRHVVAGARTTPAIPDCERIKHLACDAAGRLFQIRYIGLGPWADSVMKRADALAGRGAHATPVATRHGFALLPWLPGSPLQRGARPTRAWLDSMIDNIAARAGLFATGRPVDVDSFSRVLFENGREAGVPEPALARAARLLELLPAREAVIADSRLQPWEWLAHGAAMVHKVDTLDHGDCCRLPGPTDAAWDLAGITVEFGLEPAVMDAIVERVARRARWRSRELAAATRAWRAPYAAAMLGIAAIGARAAARPDDRRRLEAEAAFYTAALGALGSAVAPGAGRTPARGYRAHPHSTARKQAGDGSDVAPSGGQRTAGGGAGPMTSRSARRRAAGPDRDRTK